MLFDIYEGSIFRPPSEAHSLILQATIGCSWNRCTFCTAFAGKNFRAKTLKELKGDIEIVYPHYSDTTRIFLADANALCMDTDELASILEYLYSKFRNLRRVTLYGGPIDIHEKTVDELKRLREAGLSMIYLGLESGSEEVLKKVKKGATPGMMIEAGRKIREAKIRFSVMVILGLGGQELSEEHARGTAKVLSAMDPEYAAALTLLLESGAEILEDIKAGKMTLITPEQSLKEIRTIIEGMDVTHCVFRSNHPSNYVPIRGTLPEDKEEMLRQIDDALKDHNFRPETWRAL
ncbi:MAG: radical SAM protein [Candidatus Thermoplasmatota archaeon]|nr:radical SAM protein [Candidatus Thermoplasmatota archaeon]